MSLPSDLFVLAEPAQAWRTVGPSAIDTVKGSQDVTRCSVAAFTLLLYDIIITFNEEVAFVWPKPWSFMKVNYFLVRYAPLLVQIPLVLIGTGALNLSNRGCYIWLAIKGLASIFTIISVDCILIARIHALYFDNRVVRYIVSSAYIAEIVLMVMGLGLSFPGIRYDSTCITVHVPDTMVFYSCASIGFQTLIFTLTLYRFFFSVRAGWGNIPVVKLLMRDGTWAFALIFVTMLSQASLFGIRNPVYIGVLYGWVLTCFSFCGYRIFLNINRVPVSIDIAYPAHRSSSIQFTSIISGGLYDNANASTVNHERVLLTSFSRASFVESSLRAPS